MLTTEAIIKIMYNIPRGSKRGAVVETSDRNCWRKEAWARYLSSYVAVVLECSIAKGKLALSVGLESS
jgi:hypothetical protein